VSLDTSVPMPRRRSRSAVGAALAHFSGQALGVGLALLVSLLVARRLGVGHETDAFFLGRRIITAIVEALNQLLVVFYIPVIAADAALRTDAFRRVFARRALVSGIGGLVLAAALIVSSPTIVAALAPEFPADAQALSARVLAIFSAALPATTACMVFAALLNVADRFGAPSSLRQLPRALIVATLILAGGSLAVKAATAYTVGWYLVALAMLALAVPIFRAHADDHADNHAPGRAPGNNVSTPARSAPKAHGLALLALLVGALASTWLETAFAATVGTGGVTTLELGQRIGAFLCNTLAMALTLAVFARWSKAAGAAGVLPPDAPSLARALVTGACLLVPLQAFFFINSEALVATLFSHGRFTPEAAAEVAAAIRWMTLAPLSAFIFRLFVVRLLVAPGAGPVLWISLGVLVDIVVRALVFRWLTPEMGIAGIMIGQSVAPLVPIALCIAALRRRPGFFGGFALGSARGLVVAAALAAAGFLLGASAGAALARSLGLEALPAALCALAASCLLGCAAFAGVSRRLGVSVSMDLGR
jgi:peptidoglycan biosynthesis protein MviN/MurJ (putative lipid II flippase)